MAQWNSIRQLWYSRGRLVVSVAAVLVGVALVVAAIVAGFKRDWVEAVAALVAAAPLLSSGVTLFFSAKNQPEMVLCSSENETKAFMRKFISQGSSAHMASSQLSWVRGDQDMQRFLADVVQQGKELVVFAKGPDEFTEQLGEDGIRVITYLAPTGEVPHFTFLNLGRAGSKKLAVVREPLPSHWIDVYNDRQHPQVLAIASAYLRCLETMA